MKIIQYIYQGNEIEFKSISTDSVMLNATQMAKMFDRRIDFFLKSDQTKSFIEALLSVPNPENGNLFPPNGGNKFKYSMDSLLDTNKKEATYR